MRKIALALALWTWIPLCSQPLWGQTPSTRKEVTQNPKQKTTLTPPQPQIGTEAAPLIVETYARTKGDAEAAEAKADKLHTADIERWTLIFTGAAAVFTGLLVWVGWRGVRAANSTLLEISEQTKATKQSVEHLVSNERAWVILTPDPQFVLKAGLHKLDWKIWNRGKSIARIVDANIFTEKTTPGFQYRPFDEVKRLMEPIKFHNVPIPPDLSADAWCQMFDVDGLDDSAFDEIKNRGRELLAYGYVRYMDAFENERESRFVFYFAPVFNGFRIDLRAPEEYHRCT